MDTMALGSKLADMCKQKKNLEALDTLFSENVVNVEAVAPPGGERETKGLAAVKAKNKWWLENHEIHSAQVTGPYPHDDRFVLGFHYDVTNKPSGTRMKLDEVALYTVKDGKIEREEFFYSMG